MSIQREQYIFYYKYFCNPSISYLFLLITKLDFVLLSQGMSTEIKCECLDILCDVLHKYGNLMTSDHEVLLGALLPQLSTNQASVRKRAVSCIGRTD